VLLDLCAQRLIILVVDVYRILELLNRKSCVNENLGSVDELVIDVTKGQVKYVALSYGSWFTGGNKLFAVPLSSLTLNHANDKTFFLIHVSQEALKNAPGFDKNNWPNTADANWAQSIDTYYQRTATRTTIQK